MAGGGGGRERVCTLRKDSQDNKIPIFALLRVPISQAAMDVGANTVILCAQRQPEYGHLSLLCVDQLSAACCPLVTVGGSGMLKPTPAYVISLLPAGNAPADRRQWDQGEESKSQHGPSA